MIAELKFNGYKFFKDNSSFSFIPDERTQKLLSNAVEIDNKKVLKSIGLYGSNNSGKTNIIRLFGLIKKVMLGKEISSFNNLIFGDDIVTTVSVQFNNLDGKGWFEYFFAFDNNEKKYLSEKLESISFYKKGSPFKKIIFERNFIDKKFVLFDDIETEILEYVSSKKPLLYSLELDSGRFSSLNEYLNVFTDFANSIEIVKMYNIEIRNTIEALKNGDQNKKNFILSFVKSSDLSVKDFYYDNNGIQPLNSNNEINEKALSFFETAEDTFHLRTRYGEKSVLSFFHDSSGTKKIQAIASYVYDAIAQNKTLIVDEIDNGLHFQLTRAIVSAFNNMANKSGQLFFTAHDLMLIDCNFLMRKDQIYFTERTEEKSKLYCLKEFPVSEGGPREGAELVRRYKHGDFGKMPVPNYTKEIIEISKKGDKHND